MSVTLAEEGNARKGGPELAEVQQSITDIKAFFTRSGWEEGRGCGSAELQRLEKTIDVELPPALSLLLQEVDGGLWFLDKESLSSARIAEVVSDCEKSKAWQRAYVPFAGDESGLLIVDANAGSAVFEWEDGELGDQLSPTLGSYFETYRNDLLSGQFEWIDGCGVVEKVGAKARK